MLAFSAVVLDGMHTMGIEGSDEEEEARQHLWTCVGHVLGVELPLMPRDVDDARAMMQEVRNLEWRHSEHGVVLAHDLCAAIGEYIPLPDGSDLGAALMRTLACDHLAGLLRLPESWVRDTAIRLGFGIERVWDALTPGHDKATLLQKAAVLLMESLIDVQRAGKQTSFRLPPSLHHAWNLRD